MIIYIYTNSIYKSYLLCAYIYIYKLYQCEISVAYTSTKWRFNQQQVFGD